MQATADGGLMDLCATPEWTRVWAGLICYRMQEAPPAPTRNLGKISTLIILALLILAAASWPFIKSYRRAARIEELMPEFVQVSDSFTRPKFYIHKSFHKIEPSIKPRYFIYRLGAYSDGGFKIPEIPTENGSQSSGYDVIINFNERLFELGTKNYSADDRARFAEIIALADGVSGSASINLSCRVMGRDYSKVISGDFSVEGLELEAFLKTLELSKLFKESAK
jgi:hypothetical protein